MKIIWKLLIILAIIINILNIVNKDNLFNIILLIGCICYPIYLFLIGGLNNENKRN
jgi:hypothetical protein